MNQLLQAALSAPNIVYTTLLVVVILYWLTVIIGVLDMSSVEIDIDMDTDLDIDTDMSVSWWIAGLQFFNFGKVPFMLIMSFVVLFQWVFSMLCTYYLGDYSIWFAVFMLLPLLLVNLVCTKIITMPFIPFFQSMDASEEQVNYIGMICKVVIRADYENVGQAEVLFNNNPLRILVKTDDPNLGLEAGEDAQIINQNEDYFIIQKIREQEIKRIP